MKWFSAHARVPSHLTSQPRVPLVSRDSARDRGESQTCNSIKYCCSTGPASHRAFVQLETTETCLQIFLIMFIKSRSLCILRVTR